MAHLLANGLHENKQTMHLGFRQTNSSYWKLLSGDKLQSILSISIMFCFFNFEKKKKESNFIKMKSKVVKITLVYERVIMRRENVQFNWKSGNYG